MKRIISIIAPVAIILALMVGIVMLAAQAAGRQ